MKIFICFLFLSECLTAQVYDRYKWVQISSVNYLRKIERYAPNGRDSVEQTRFEYYADTASFRVGVKAKMTEKRAQSTEAYALYEKLDAAADSLYAVLQDLNDGYGYNDPEPLKEPVNPAREYKAERWGAILPGSRATIQRNG